MEPVKKIHGRVYGGPKWTVSPVYEGMLIGEHSRGNDLTIVMNEDGSSTVVVTSFSDAANGDLAINGAANNWSANADIQTASTQLSAALTTLRGQAQSLSSNLSTVQIRQEPHGRKSG